MTAPAARVGSRSHLVAVDQDKDKVREFGVYTADHQKLIEHLRQYDITTIAMESTGSYWQTLFNALQQAGFQVLLVGGNQTKNVKAGRPVPPQDGCHRLPVDSKVALAGLIVGKPAIERYLSAATNLLPSPAAPDPAVGSLQQQDAEVLAADEPATGCGTQ